jgi:hypothetical protein
MHQLLYTMPFKGYAAPVGASPHVLQVITIASSCTLTTAIGAVTWHVERGEGQLAGASGLIISNFCVSATGEVTDYHCGVLWGP